MAARPDRPRLSRWGRSPYERPADLEAEAHRLSPWVEVLPPGCDAEILVVTSKDPVHDAVLDRAPACRLVMTTTSGHDHLDLAALRRRGVQAGRCPMARRDAVADAALGLILHGLRAVGPLTAAAREGRWAREALPQLGMRTLAGAHIGVIGLGVIGREVARRLQLLGARVSGHDPAGLPDGVAPLGVAAQLAACDAVTLHCRLEPGSAGVVGAAELQGSRPDLVLVNTARGDVLDLRAALRRLADGGLQALAVDVFPVEPWPDMAAVAAHPGLVLLPHAVGYHVGLHAAIQEELESAVRAFAEGRPLPHPVA